MTIHMPNNYSDEDWNDLTDDERTESLRMARQAAYLDDDEKAALQNELHGLYEDLNGETDYDVIRDIEREIGDLEEMLSMEPDDDGE